MSAQLTLTCDHPNCPNHIHTHPGETWWARLNADQHGWNTSDHGDYCPTHAHNHDFEVAA